AGLFYIVRLFVYYAEAQEKSETEKKILSDQYQLMTNRLWFIITFPAAVLAPFFGVWMLIENPALLQMPWMHVKLLFVLLLLLYFYFSGCGFSNFFWFVDFDRKSCTASNALYARKSAFCSVTLAVSYKMPSICETNRKQNIKQKRLFF